MILDSGCIGDNGEDGEKWLVLGCILKMRLKEFVEGLRVGCEKRSGVKDDY